MKYVRTAPAALLLFILSASTASAQHLHTNDRWRNCSIVLDPSLTQGAWREFIAEVAPAVYFRPLASARPLGRGRLEVSLVTWATRVDDTKPAWNDTFSHPDSSHVLVPGDALIVPAGMLRVGLSDRVDVGAYFTKSIGANYGLYGAQVQYAKPLGGSEDTHAAVRASAVRLFGADDVALEVYGVDLLVSREFGRVTPYAAVSALLSHGHERSDKVDLENETVAGLQGMTGLVLRLGPVRLAGEVSVARVPGYSLRIAVAP